MTLLIITIVGALLLAWSILALFAAMNTPITPHPAGIVIPFGFGALLLFVSGTAAIVQWLM